MMHSVSANTDASMGFLPIQIAALRMRAGHFALVVVYCETVLVVSDKRAFNVMRAEVGRTSVFGRGERRAGDMTACVCPRGGGGSGGVGASCNAVKDAHVSGFHVSGTGPFDFVIQAAGIGPEIQFLVGRSWHVVAVTNFERTVVNVNVKRIFS